MSAKIKIIFLLIFIITSISSLKFIFASTDITNCGNIDSPGYYKMNTSIENASQGICILISSSDVIFDGQGYTIDGISNSSSIAISVGHESANLTNVTVKNTVIKEFGTGIEFGSPSTLSVDNSLIENNTIFSTNNSGINLYSLYSEDVLDTSYNNTNRIINNNVSYNEGDGIHIRANNNDSVENNIITFNKGMGLIIDYGSRNYLKNNTLYNNSFSEMALGVWDFTFNEDNTVIDQIFGYGSYQINVSLTFFGNGTDIFIKSINSTPVDPSDYINIGKYINITKVVPESVAWVFLNISYSDEDLEGLDESTLIMARYNGTWETNTSAFSSSYGVDKNKNYFYANITDFSSTFALLAINDTNAPNITLNLPDVDAHLSNYYISFNCSALDTIGLSNITLYGNWSGGWHANETKNISGTSNSTNFIKRLSEGIYEWNCYACDTSGNCDFASANRTFTIKKSGGGGGGGTVGNITNNTINATNITQSRTNVTINIGKIEGERYIAGQKNDKIFFILNGTNHSIDIINITNSSATLLILSQPIQMTLNIDETKELDLNENGKNDFSIKLLSITNNTANFLIKEIQEQILNPICGNQICELGEESSCLSDCKNIEVNLLKMPGFWAMIFILLALLVYIIVVTRKKVAHRKKFLESDGFQ